MKESMILDEREGAVNALTYGKKARDYFYYALFCFPCAFIVFLDFGDFLDENGIVYNLLMPLVGIVWLFTNILLPGFAIGGIWAFIQSIWKDKGKDAKPISLVGCLLLLYLWIGIYLQLATAVDITLGIATYIVDYIVYVDF